MGRKSFNTRVFSDILNHPAGFVGSAAFAACSLFGLMLYIDQPSEEQKQSKKFETEISTTTLNFVDYELLGPDTIRAEGPFLSHEFHFSSGQIYVTRGNETRPSIDFDEVNRQEWITETRKAGCLIANQTLGLTQDAGFDPELLEEKQGIAARYIELNCGE